jgi:hypothetical protein
LDAFTDFGTEYVYGSGKGKLNCSWCKLINSCAKVSYALNLLQQTNLQAGLLLASGGTLFALFGVLNSRIFVGTKLEILGILPITLWTPPGVTSSTFCADMKKWLKATM